MAGTGEDDGYTLYTWYVPANKRGTDTNSTTQKSKNQYAPQGATYFRIYATSGGQPVIYTYYLGANLTNNFDLEPNKKYTYTVEINGKGDPSTDARIEDLSPVTFTRDANSYMLKPPAYGDGQTAAERIYKIPVRRAAVFWNQPGTNMGVYSAALVQSGGNSYLLEETTTWKAWVVWNEVKYADGTPVPDNELLSGAGLDSDPRPDNVAAGSVSDTYNKYVVTGKGFNPAGSGADHNPFVPIKVKSGMYGNAVIAIKKTSSPSMNDVLWSWHIWVTDYDPYVPMTVESGTYIYSVPNGEIHRYADKSNLNPAIWGTGGVYASAFMMDRNLGAEVALTGAEDAVRTYGLYYQWGRKDPFKTLGNVASVAADGTGAPGEGSPKQNIRYSIHNPTTFIYRDGNWTAYESTSPILGAVNTVWNDPFIGNHGTDNCESGKSIYDPCPTHELKRRTPSIDAIHTRRLTYILFETRRAAYKAAKIKRTLKSFYIEFGINKDTYYDWQLKWYHLLPSNVKNLLK